MSQAVETQSCFKDIISLRGSCDYTPSTSGLYSNDIDISIDFINEIINKNYKSAEDFFNKKLSFAIKSITDQVLTALSSSLRTGTLLDNFRIGVFQDNLKLIAGDGNLKGINFDLCNSDSYLNFFLKELSIQVNSTQTISVFVYDLIQNKLLDTIDIDAVADEITTVYPNKIYKSDRKKLNLFIGYDSTGISSNTTYLSRNSTCSNCNGSTGINNSYEKIHGAKIAASSQKIKANLKYIGETGGLSVVHSVQCNHEDWLCSFSNLMALPILYKYGIEVMEFADNVSRNTRINTTVSLNNEEIKNRIELYSQKLTESLNNLLPNIEVPSDSKCFNCKTPVHHQIILP